MSRRAGGPRSFLAWETARATRASREPPGRGCRPGCGERSCSCSLARPVLCVSFWLVGRLRSLIVMLLVSLFLASAMEPAANYLARRGWRRGPATATAFAVLVGVVVAFVADGPRLRRTVCSVLPPDRQQLAMRIWELATESTGGYVYSRALLAGVSATATTLFLALVGVPHPFALGIWVGLVSQFVPSIGTYLAGALPVLIALFHNPSTPSGCSSSSPSTSSSRTWCCPPGSRRERCRCTRPSPSGRSSRAAPSSAPSAPSWPCRRRPASRRWCPCTSIAARWWPVS